MSSPVALGRPQTPLLPPARAGDHPVDGLASSAHSSHIDWGDNALTAPITPGKRMAVVNRENVHPQIRQAAEGMEAMFLDYMMKVMRDTVPENELALENPATKIYQGMMDSEMAQKAARTGGIGLSDQIIAYLESQRYTVNRGQAASAAVTKAAESTGGTHEGQPVRK